MFIRKDVIEMSFDLEANFMYSFKGVWYGRTNDKEPNIPSFVQLFKSFFLTFTSLCFVELWVTGDLLGLFVSFGW